MTIVKTMPENLTENKKMLYVLTKGQSTMAKTIDERQRLTPVAFCEFIDTDKDGKENNVLSILTEECGVVSTISNTFRREFYDMADMFAGEEFSFRVIHGKTKAGRDFTSCTLYVEDVDN